MLWRLAASRALHSTRTQQHYRDHIGVAEREHMSEVDCFDGAEMRGRSAGHGKGNGNGKKVGQDKDEKNDPRKVSKEREGDLLTINPEVDGRFRDVGRE
jgi:5'-nucleotidase